MKISDVGLAEGLFSNIAAATTGDSGIGQDFEDKIQKRAKKYFIADFKKDLLSDFTRDIKNGTISVPATKASSSKSSEPTPRQAVQPTAQSRQDALARAAARKSSQTPQNTNIDADHDYMATGYNESEDYSDLDALFESVIAEQTAESITQWVVRWVDAYMRGTDWEDHKPQVLLLAKQIQDTYSTDRGLASIDKLAKLAWEITDINNEVPFGAQNVPSMQQDVPTITPEFVASYLKNLKKTDPKTLDKIRKALR